MNREALAIRRFIEALSHDLRTPLAAILGYHELLSDGVYGELASTLHEPISRIGSAAKQLEQLIAGVDELSRPLDEIVPVHTAPVEPRGVIDDAIALARRLATERGATLDVTVDEPLAPLNTDAERLGWLLGVALAAAVRSSPRGRLRIRVSCSPDRFRLEITGTTLSPGTTVPLTAESFADAAGDERRASLRLAIVRRLARQLGGELELVPDDGVAGADAPAPDPSGTRMLLEIPASTRPARP
ncbi:MAG: sensor histidine kinase [Longimicrobiales bacterium]